MVRTNCHLLWGVGIRIASHQDLGDVENAYRDFAVILKLFFECSTDLSNPSELIEARVGFGG
ncbi:hypothetical protein TIFTF001_019119 [Ficus carica]|uniref:Uncharacterized protein n=1 Tax=Ficus carica TaxID=3494 RepID=A0AA88DBG3_FICCA|nr:hypothetical protein TIFTF001_019119 [Ficus carica]